MATLQQQIIYYDLSELYAAKRGKLKYYGIARVVAEVAYEMHRLRRGVVFVIFDESRGGFFEVTPNFGKASDNGIVDLGIPMRAVPFKLRGTKVGRSAAAVLVARITDVGLRVVNRTIVASPDRYMRPVVLDDGFLLSAARPKLIAQFADHLAETGSRTRLHALLHDCIPLHDFHPGPKPFQLDFQANTAKVIRAASHVISNSAFTQADLIAMAASGMLPPLPAHSVVALAHECRPDGQASLLVPPDRDYVIGVGITFGRKNLDVVLDAQLHLLAQGKTPPLMVIAGANRRRTMARLTVGRYAPLAPHVLMVGNPSQADLIELYRKALATVMPSRLEGWGLPVGESLWLNTPVLISPLSSLPEVGGDLAVYFDPDSPSELAGLFERLRSDDIYRGGLRDRIAGAKPGLRSWRDVASEMLQTVSASMEALPEIANRAMSA